jgi:putative transposase
LGDRALEEPALERGLRQRIAVDYGLEFACRAMGAWAYERGVRLQLIQPGKPGQNASVESFHGRLRDEWLNAHWLRTLVGAGSSPQEFRKHYCTMGPHISLEIEPRPSSWSPAVRSSARRGWYLEREEKRGAGRWSHPARPMPSSSARC